MRVDWTSDPQAFVAEDWSDLTYVDPEGTFFHTSRYLKLYWEEFARGELHIASLHDGDRRVAAAAFEVTDGVLAFLGGADVTDYAGPVAEPAYRDVVAKELLTSLAQREDWERAELRGVAEEGAWAAALRAAADGAGLAATVSDDGVAPFLELPRSYEEYLSSLPAKRRHEIRRKRRRIEERLEEVRVVDSTPTTIAGDLDRFVGWHRASEGSKGRFMVPGMELFFRRLADELLAEGVFRLSFLEAGDRPLAGAIGFRDRRRFLLYNSAYDHEAAALAPGMVLVSELIRDTIRAGCDAFDFLRGDLDYKYRFGARPRSLMCLRLTRR